MKRLIPIFILPIVLSALAAWAQLPMHPLPLGTKTVSVAYVGPGDIINPAGTAWWGLRAFSAAKRGNAAVNVCNI